MAKGKELEKKTKLTVKEKTTAEKVIKLHYNNLINGVKGVTSTVEEAAEGISCTSGYNSTPIMDQEHVPMALRIQLVLLKRKQEDAERKYNELVRDYNAQQSDIRREAQAKRRQVVDRLRAMRDEAILNITFQGEGEHMLEFLKSLIDKGEVLRELKSLGIELTKELPSSTGIGEGTPTNLNEDYRSI